MRQETAGTDSSMTASSSGAGIVKSFGPLKPVYSRRDKRGLFLEIINERSWEGIHYGEMHEGHHIGGSYHKVTEAFFFVLEGQVEVSSINVATKKEELLLLGKDEGAYLRPFHVNTLSFKEQSKFILLKSHKFNSDNNDTYSMES
ncbi:MAG: WxcM-like domain-containing protein [Oligoflexales bacterium]|nr:WxcM-like domain-containing protein [Oligoflexales bacterium]